MIIVGAAPAVDTAWEVAELIGAEHVAVLPTAEPWIVDRFAEQLTDSPPGRMLAVIGGRGGAGASVLAGALAVTAVRAGKRTLLVDADPLGGGLDLVLGWEEVDGLRWSALTGAGGRVDPPALIQALPQRGDLVLLSFARDESVPIPGEAMAATLDAARRARDVIIVDLPRHLDDAAVLALQAADRTLLVVPAELRATAAATRVAAMAALHCDERLRGGAGAVARAVEAPRGGRGPRSAAGRLAAAGAGGVAGSGTRGGAGGARSRGRWRSCAAS